ncbi:MAG TPA: hypothetical protein VMW08_00455 [Acidimicrobiales bacterium]|nr:hypothetical protein [Acidimicrobiales bacterium]
MADTSRYSRPGADDVPEVTVIPGPSSASCACGHHLNQHNGMTTHPDDGGVIASGYCVACDCSDFDATRRGELITPSYTEGEWVDVFERFLADRHCILYGQARPCSSDAERRAVAEWFAAEVIAAAGEVIEG